MVEKKAVQVPKQDVKARVHNFQEVVLGYNAAQAVKEAERCLQCKNAPCIIGCPVGVDVPKFIKLISERKFEEALKIIKEANSLPAICGRVCPQEEQCTKYCTLGIKFEPISIGKLERFIADLNVNQGSPKPRVASTGKKVAIVGSGPAGLTAAAELAKLGHQVVIFEALHASGGVLIYGIPDFRLPKDVVNAEIDYIKKLGVKIKNNIVIGKTYSVDELLHRFDAIFIGTGAGLPHFLHIPGENLPGVYSANEFLIRSNLMKACRFPEYDTPIKIGRRVVTVGGGNVAMDVARTALRLGAEASIILYRRTKKEMPARDEEIENALEEGVKFHILSQPLRILGKDRVEGVECMKMRLGEPDESGRRRPIPILDSTFTIDADIVVVAIGQAPNPLIPKSTSNLKVNKNGTIWVEKETLMTSKKGVFAGGDIVTGEATVILAMGAGKRAALSIHEFIMNKNRR